MDKDRLKKLCISALDISMPSLIMSDFSVVPTYKFNDPQNDWIPDSHTIFIRFKSNGEYLSHEVERFLEALLGFDCCVDFS